VLLSFFGFVLVSHSVVLLLSERRSSARLFAAR
jgi:hypothetical protein